jgi:DNA-binding NarL/FixJ family response regulator
MINTSSNRKDLVLIIDDSPENLGMLNQALEREGMETLVALEGVQGLSIARKMTPDIILLDAMMPNMDGFEVCHLLKQDVELKSIPVIFMTGLSDSDSVVKGFASGGIDYVTKPIINSELIARMRVHLSNNRLTRSAQSALDIAGQYVFAVDDIGPIVWSTSQVSKLFDTSKDNSHWLKTRLHLELKTWLATSPSNGMSLRLNAPQHILKVVFLGKENTNEYLLRLIDTELPNESQLLQTSLNLTVREAEVLLWIAKGKTNRDIGEILGISPRTINKHSENIYKKLGVENRTSASAMAMDYLDH